MSSLFSDPPFSRGTTLLNGEAIEYSSGDTYADKVPIAGTEIVGTVKVFTDIHPSTHQRYSNDLVYCVAARFKPASESTVLNSDNTGADAGKAYVLRMSSSATNLQSVAEFTSEATAADVVAGKRIGFLDEYLNTKVRANDIVWLVVRGPANVAKKTGSALNSGAAISLDNAAGTAGVVKSVASIVPVATANSESVVMGVAIGTLDAATNDQTLGANAASADTKVRAVLLGTGWSA